MFQTEKLANAICKTKNSYYIYLFALNIKNVHLDKLTDATCKTNDAKVIYKLC